MNCSMKTMLKVGAGMLLVVGTAYLLFPGFRETIIALSPVLLFLLCPLSMFFCMKMMQGQNGQACQPAASDEQNKRQAAPATSDATTK